MKLKDIITATALLFSPIASISAYAELTQYKLTTVYDAAKAEDKNAAAELKQLAEESALGTPAYCFGWYLEEQANNPKEAAKYFLMASDKGNPFGDNFLQVSPYKYRTSYTQDDIRALDINGNEVTFSMWGSERPMIATPDDCRYDSKD